LRVRKTWRLTAVGTDCTAICSGRTLLKNSNGWLNDLAPMALQDPFVNHCLLALSAGYAMDYDRNEQLRDRANHHFFHANQFLEQKLQDPTTFTSNVADAVVAGIRLMWSDDVCLESSLETATNRPRSSSGSSARTAAR
jgi:Fungal specific transcription factor domain